MNFGEALQVVKKEGKKVQRIGWNGKGMYIFDFYSSVLKLKEDKEFEQERYDLSELEGIVEVGLGELTYKLENFILLKTAGNTCIPWNASQADMLADDWQIVDVEISQNFSDFLTNP
jgi:hypothetical protein